MSDFFIEQYASRASKTGNNPSVRFMYVLGRTDDEALVRALLEQNAPATYDGLGITGTENEPLGGGVWRSTVDYGIINTNTNDPNAGGSGGGNDGNQQGDNDALPLELTVDCQGVNQHVTQSLYTAFSKKKVGDTRNVPNHKGAINVSKEGVAGCDIIVPGMFWTETWTFLARYVTWGYLRRLRNLVGRVNHTTFRTFAGGEVMLRGFNSSPHGKLQRRIAYTFASEPNITGFMLTPEFEPVDKEGMEFLWVDYEPNPTSDALPMVPRAVYVERTGRPGAPLLDSNGNPTNKANFLTMGIGR